MNPENGSWRHNGPWECCHVCMALSGCCPIVVTVALGVPVVQAYTKRSPVEMKAPANGGVMSGQFSGRVNKWMDSSPKPASVTVCGERKRDKGVWQLLLALGRVGHLWSPSWSITAILTAVFAPSLLLLLLSVSAQTQNTNSLFPSSTYSVSVRSTCSWCNSRRNWCLHCIPSYVILLKLYLNCFDTKPTLNKQVA